jgi:NodT family efflux transporter outer membrane factor (OMF) lipoprotein
MKKISFALFSLMLSGCAMVGPDFKAPEAPQVAAYSGEAELKPTEETPQLVVQDTLPQQWWQLFQSDTLSQLVRQGLENSPTMTAAEAKLRASQETLQADTGNLLYPKIDATLDTSRQRISGATFGNSGNDSVFNVHNASVKVNYDIDPFGGSRRYLEYQQAVIDYDALQLEAARITLATNIVTTALTEASLREQIKAMNAIISDETDVLEVVEKQFVIGVIPKADLLSQRASLAAERTQLPALQKALAQTRHQLATLSGSLPSDSDALPQLKLDTLTMPREVPVTLPSTLTRRRPDVRAAEALLHQASAQVGVATTALYPKLTLSAAYGTESAKLSDLFSAGSAVWGIAAGLTQPIFRAGELKARKRAARANYDRAAALYRQQVLEAFREVADALLAIEMDGRQLTLEKEAEQLAIETLALVREQYKQGAVSYLALLDAQRRHQQTRISFIKARVALYNDTAALMYALGGGWDSGTNTPKTSAETSIPTTEKQS